MFGLTKTRADDLLTIVFTSGSTGEPKGVMLSHHNIRSNVDAIEQMYQLKPTDVLLGVLPFFHSFGFTGTMWSCCRWSRRGCTISIPSMRESSARCARRTRRRS